MEIRLNGEMRAVAEGLSVQQLVDLLGLAERRVAIELNRDIVPRARFAAVRLQPGDVVEVVQFVGGG